MPPVVRVALALGLGAAAAAAGGGTTPGDGLSLAVGCARELALGTVLAFLVTMPVEAARAAGRLADTFRGATLCELHVAPIRQRESAAGDLLAQWVVVLAAWAGGDRLVVQGLLSTFAAIPPGAPLELGRALPSVLARRGGARRRRRRDRRAGGRGRARRGPHDRARRARRAAARSGQRGAAGARGARAPRPGRRRRRRGRSARRDGSARGPDDRGGRRGGAVSGNRTEQPTPKRLREARRRGEVAQSRELTGAAALAGGLLALAATGGSAARELASLPARPARRRGERLRRSRHRAPRGARHGRAALARPRASPRSPQPGSPARSRPASPSPLGRSRRARTA